MKNQRNFLDDLAKKLNIRNPQDWYGVKNANFQKLGGGKLLCQYKSSLYRILKTLHPEYLSKLVILLTVTEWVGRIINLAKLPKIIGITFPINGSFLMTWQSS